MSFHHFFKKGFSPLVATILLIAFSVSLLTAVITWEGSFGFKKDDPCSKIAFNLEASNGLQFCYKQVSNNIEVNFIVKNKGNVDIDGMSMLIIGSANKKIYDLNDIKIKKDSLLVLKDLVLEYDLSYHGDINKIYLTPHIASGDGVTDICPNHLIEIEKIGECS